TLYRFFWSEFCDWYLETRKATLAQTGAGKSNILAVTDFVLSHVLRLLHPFLPFITEELWRGMGYAGDMPADQGGKTIMFAPWPKSLGDDFKSHYGLDESQERLIELRNAFIVQGRNLRRTANIPANKKVKFIFQPAQPIVPEDVEILKLLLGAGAIEIAPNFQPGKHILSIRHEFGALYLPVEGLVDIAAERGRLEKAREKIQAEIAKVSQKLADPHFTGKVPAAVLEEHETRLRQRRNELAATEAGVKALSD
ncbi:MAG: class I tRNA ligase family protein, partial [Verrucomicrobia bacterium]|nr:class I tRNA ligase family protein [Verrucomicrobiota bacterium]